MSHPAAFVYEVFFHSVPFKNIPLPLFFSLFVVFSDQLFHMASSLTNELNSGVVSDVSKVEEGGGVRKKWAAG
jgi:hypothetical protein